MASSTPSAFQKVKEKAPRHSAEEWEAERSNIERLYITEDRPLQEVLPILKQDFGFFASEQQVKKKLPKWGLDVKYLKADTMFEMARIKAKRAVEDKKSSFRINKNNVDDRRVERFLRKNDLSEEQLLSVASPVDAPSPGFSGFTPDSIRSSTPGLNIQTLSMADPPPMVEQSQTPSIPEISNAIQAETTELSTGEPLFMQR